MKFLLDFFRQKVPRMGRETPLYFRNAMQASEVLLMCYYALCFVFFPAFGNRWEWLPIPMTAMLILNMWLLRTQNPRTNLLFFTLHCFIWVGWNVYAYGWSIGVQHFLTLLVILVFFNVYEQPWGKVVWLALIMAFRICLYSYSQRNAAVYPLSGGAATAYQMINTAVFFLIMACMCITFSTSIQDTERQLRLRNQTLYKEAGTDPLTGLPNRRAMIEQIEKYQKSAADPTFSVAIADIDYFKKINDTYGHNCGDYTLVKLTELFVTHSAGRYSVCRWGGEEFCFFLPGMNLDEAGIAMNDLAYAVENMKLSFEDHDFSITITVGVEETNFSSPLEELLDSADKKLYMGKEAGRNRVIV